MIVCFDIYQQLLKLMVFKFLLNPNPLSRNWDY